MTAPSLTLKQVKEKAQTKVSRVSDFLTNEEKLELKKANAAGKRSKRVYNAVDAYVAEIIARFGFETYTAWLNGEINEDKMARLVAAERAREKRILAPLEEIIISSVAGANQPTKNKQTPKSLKAAIKILKEEQKRGQENG